MADFKKGGPNAKELPGWKGFQTIIGDDKKTREFFAEMYSAEFALLESSAAKPEKLGEKLQQRCTELQNATQQFGYQLSLPTVATVLYLTTHENAKQNATVSSMASNFCSQNAFRQAIANGEQSDLMKKLLVGLMRSMTGTANYQLIMLCLQYDIKECYEPARRFTQSTQQNGYAKANAIFAVAVYGSKEKDTAILEKLLTDKQQCTTYSINGKRYVTKVCDAALVGLLELYKIDPRKNGFKRFQKNRNQIAVHTIGFETDKERDEVMKTWPELKKKGDMKPEENAAAKKAEGKEAEGKEAAKEPAKKEAAKKEPAKKEAAKEEPADKKDDEKKKPIESPKK